MWNFHSFAGMSHQIVLKKLAENNFLEQKLIFRFNPTVLFPFSSSRILGYTILLLNIY